MKYYKVDSIWNVYLIGGRLSKQPAQNYVCASNGQKAVELTKKHRAKGELANPRDHYFTSFRAKEIPLSQFVNLLTSNQTLFESLNAEYFSSLLSNNLRYEYDYCWSLFGYFIRPEGIEKVNGL